MFNVIVKQFHSLPAIDKKEVFRYAGGKGELGDTVNSLMDECIQEASSAITGKACAILLSKQRLFDLLQGEEESLSLKKNLNGCEEVVIFAATIGSGIDTLIRRYGKISVAKSLFFQAIWAERIECVCNCLGSDLAQSHALHGKVVRPRFSPGYGDFSLSAQKILFRILNPEKHLGISLTDSLMILPSKSVTALMGIGNASIASKNCTDCNQTDCQFKRN